MEQRSAATEQRSAATEQRSSGATERGNGATEQQSAATEQRSNGATERGNGATERGNGATEQRSAATEQWSNGARQRSNGARQRSNGATEQSQIGGHTSRTLWDSFNCVRLSGQNRDLGCLGLKEYEKKLVELQSSCNLHDQQIRPPLLAYLLALWHKTHLINANHCRLSFYKSHGFEFGCSGTWVVTRCFGPQVVQAAGFDSLLQDATAVHQVQSREVIRSTGYTCGI